MLTLEKLMVFFVNEIKKRINQFPFVNGTKFSQEVFNSV